MRISRCRIDLPRRDVDGVPTVHAAVAIAQVAQEVGVEAAVVSGDAALAGRLVTREELYAGAELLRLLRSSSRPHEALAMMDERSESPGESRLRVLAAQGGVALDPQYVVRDRAGAFVARCDFRIIGTRTLVEFDGRLKYTGQEALYAEKRREDAVRALGWGMLRLVWADLADPPAVLARLRAAQ